MSHLQTLAVFQPFLYNPPSAPLLRGAGLHDSLDSPGSGTSGSSIEPQSSTDAHKPADETAIEEAHKATQEEVRRKGALRRSKSPSDNENSRSTKEEPQEDEEEEGGSPCGPKAKSLHAPSPIKAPTNVTSPTSPMEHTSETYSIETSSTGSAPLPLPPTPNIENDPLAMSTASSPFFMEDSDLIEETEEEGEGRSDGPSEAPEEDVSDSSPDSPEQLAKAMKRNSGATTATKEEEVKEESSPPRDRPVLQPLRLLTVSSRRSRSGRWRLATPVPPPHHRADSSPFLSLEDDTPWPSFASPFPSTPVVEIDNHAGSDMPPRSPPAATPTTKE